MNDGDISILSEAIARRLRNTSCAFHRYLYPKIAWDDRLICIKGPRGVGKTTMLLQRMKEKFGRNGKAFPVAGRSVRTPVQQNSCVVYQILFRQDPAVRLANVPTLGAWRSFAAPC